MHTIAEYTAMRERSKLLEDAFAMGFERLTLTNGGQPEFVGGKLFSSNAFEFLGVKPLLGRTFLPDDYGSGGTPRPVILLSYLLWQRRFASDPGIIGREVRLNGQNHTVIGVMPKRFTLYTNPDQPAIWLPLPVDPSPERRVLVHARLRPGVTLQKASAELHSILAPFAEADPRAFPGQGFKVRLRPFTDWVRPWIRTTVYVLQAAVGFLLLIACANVANLLLARACARTREISVRLAIGARRWHVMKQLLTESVQLSVGGGALGVLLAIWGTKALVKLLPPYAINSEMDIRVNGAVLAGSFMVAVLTGILFGLAPALHAMRVDINQTLKEGEKGSSGGVTGRRTRSALVILAFAFSMVLLAGAGLMIRTLIGLTWGGVGVRTDHVLTMWLPPPPEADSAVEQRMAFYRNVLEHLQGAPGVRSATVAWSFPPYGGRTTKVELETRTAAQRLEAAIAPVSAGYFETIGIPLLRGEIFTSSDVARAEHAAVINQTAARQFFPGGEDPIGKIVSADALARGKTAVDPRVRIVAIVADSLNAGLREKPIPQLFVRFTLMPSTFYGLAIRTASAPLAALPAVRARIADIDKDQPLAFVRTLEEMIAMQTGQERFITVLLSVFAAFGLALAAIGIYSAMSYTVSQRTREIGIRGALGAGPRDLIRLVVFGGARLALIGIAAGTLGGIALTRLIRSQLYGVTPTDPLAFASVAVLLCAVGLAACYIPARRAAMIDPMTALRHE
jgi:putative ABC transport system permease protein